MNAASVFGRTVPNFAADHFGPLNGRSPRGCTVSESSHSDVPSPVLIPSGIISAGLIFGMFGATSVAGVTAFAVFYGFFSGGRKWPDN